MAGSERLEVELQPDTIERLTKARPIAALAEFIWNALDADADNVQVRLERDALDGLSKIVLTDQGAGLSRTDALQQFSRYGGSWKSPGGVTKKHARALHGAEGRGRFNAFALGRVVDWKFVYELEPGGERRAYTVSMVSDNATVAIVSEEKKTTKKSGATVTISELHRNYTSLEKGQAIPVLLGIFALHLLDYRDIRIEYDGAPVDALVAVQQRNSVLLAPIQYEATEYDAELEIVEWKSLPHKSLQLCTETGIPLAVVGSRFHVSGDFRFSAYLKSAAIAELHKNGTLDFAANSELVDAIEQARVEIKVASQRSSAEEAKGIVERWKEEKVYPFEGEASSSVETMERQIFDIVAVTASSQISDFETAATKNRALQLRLLRAAVEKSPTELQLILAEVLKLPAKTQSELAELLRECSLATIISASKTVADRLKTLEGLAAIIFDKDTKKRLKERAQLHQILNDNSWIFEDEYNLSVSDKGLTNVLRAHKTAIGESIVIDEPVRHVDKKTGIVDLMFSKSLPSHRPKDTEHLVVELKAPGVVLSSKDTSQIKGYAFSIASDDRFKDANTKWVFWLLSNEMDNFVSKEVRQVALRRGMLYQGNDPDITIWVKTWSEVIDENKAKLKFFKDRLEHSVDVSDAVKYVGDKYRHFLEGVLSEVEASDGAG